MKKTFFIMLMPIVLLSFNACNNSESQQEKDKIDTTGNTSSQNQDIKFDCAGVGNLNYVATGEAQKMIEHFTVFFHNGITSPQSMKKFKDSIWIDAAVIEAFSDFLDKEASTFDGVRVVSAAYGNDSSTVIFVPTKPGEIGSSHSDSWETMIPVKGGDYKFRNFNLDTNFSLPAIRKFNSLYRLEKIPGDHTQPNAGFDNLSAKVWFGPCIFKLLNDILKSSGNTLDGVRLYFAAYNTKDAARRNYQNYDDQSTIVLVPTKPGDKNEHITDWGVIKSKFDSLKKSNSAIFGGYNHGQLCPNQCD